MGADVRVCQSVRTAAIRTGQDGRAARHQVFLFTDNTWSQSIHELNTQTHTGPDPYSHIQLETVALCSCSVFQELHFPDLVF